MNKQIKTNNSINPLFTDQIEFLTFLKTQVENLHAVSHFKHETLSTLNYAQDFEKMVNESLKKITTWAAKYFTLMTSLIIPSLILPCLVRSLNHGSSSGANNGKRRWSRDEGLDGELSTCSPTNCKKRNNLRSVKLDLYHQLSTLSPSKQNIAMWSLILSQQLLTTHQRRDGAVVRALASHQCDPGSIPGPGDVICGLSLLLVLFSAPRGFSPGTSVFSSPQKPPFSNSNSILKCTGIYERVHVTSLVLRG